MQTLDTASAVRPEDRDLLREVKKVVRAVVPDAVVLLYGSAARGTREPDSDYDLLILVEDALSREVDDVLHNALYNLELERDVVLSEVVHTNREWNTPLMMAMPFHKNVSKDGVVI